MRFTPILAHGGEQIPFLVALGLAVGLFVRGITLVINGKEQRHATVGFVFCVASMLVVILTLKFYGTLLELFGLR
jgi:hypothetical protein